MATKITDQRGQPLSVTLELNGYYVDASIKTPDYPYNGTRVSFNEETECISIDPRYDSGFSGHGITMKIYEFLSALEIPSKVLETAAGHQFESVSNHQSVIDAARDVAQLRLEGKNEGMDEALDKLLDAVLKMG